MLLHNKKEPPILQPQATKRYMPGLDGLRTFAVFAVILYHLNVNWASGGLLGVSIFFVLSGYLITDLLISEWRSHGRIELMPFWIRRFRRLLPAMILMLVTVVTYLTLLEPSRLAAIKGDVLSSLFYFNNWYLIFHHVSYFESFGPPSPLGHLWSLAVEEQFYLLWPLLLMIGLRWFPRRGQMFVMIISCAALSALAMLLMYDPGTDPSRVYYGTDTRAFSLLIGAALSIVWPRIKLTMTTPTVGVRLLDATGILSLIAITYMIFQTNEYDSFLYPSGLILLSVLTVVVVAAIAHPASLLGKWLGLKPLRWLGVRSYGIYIWHYPVIVLTSPLVQSDQTSVLRAVVQIMLSIILAALSYRYIEQPIRGGIVGRVVKKLISKELTLNQLSVNGRAMVAISLALVVISCTGMALPSPKQTTDAALVLKTSAGLTNELEESTSKQTNDPSSVSKPELKTTGPKLPSTEQFKVATAERYASSEDQKTDKKTVKQPKANDQQVNTVEASAKNNADTPRAARGGVTAIGDSILLDAAPYLSEYIPDIVINAHIGRQMSEAPDVVAQLRSSNQLGKTIIIELGTNGAFSKQQLHTLLDSLKDARKIILVNTRVPRGWEQVVNTALSKAAATYPNAVLVDWHTASKGRSFFSQDGVHLEPDGAKMLASLIAKSAGYKG